MKYGQALYERSVPHWAPYNIDYNELKHLIKSNTTRDQAQAVTIPGHPDEDSQIFEDSFVQVLFNQHDRVDLFVKSKAGEFQRQLLDYDQKANKLIARCVPEYGGMMTLRRRERLSKLETRIMRCGEGIRNLDRFVQAQNIGFRKILKKFKKWTGSTTLTLRTDQFLNDPKSFTKFDFEPLYRQYNTLIERVREHSPSHSECSTPLAGSRLGSRRGSHSPADFRKQVTAVQKAYWNEYDNPSEDENEPYTIYFDPDHDYGFPGQKTIAHAFTYLSDKMKPPLRVMRRLINPYADLDERQPLVGGDGTSSTSRPTTRDTDVDDDDDVFSVEFPQGYATHYATFPSVREQKFAAHREKLLFLAMIGCLVAATILLLVSGLLLATGRHKLKAEVDAGVIMGNMVGLVFACLGFNIMLYRWERVGPGQRVVVSGLFVISCLVGGVELVLAMG